MNMADEKRELLVLGNFVGRLLESFPFLVRLTAVKDIEEAEERFCKESSDLRPILAQQLWKIEHIRRGRRDPRLKRKKEPGSYGDTIESYLTALPQKFRAVILKEICDIISYHGSNCQKG